MFGFFSGQIKYKNKVIKMFNFRTTVLAVLFLTSSTCQAIDSSPGDYGWFGDNAKILVLYGTHQNAHRFTPDSGNALPDSEIEANISVLRGVYYREIDNIKASFQFFAPYGKVDTARVGGVDQEKSDGIGDLTIGGTIYPISSPENTGTTLGLSAFVTSPTGNHNINRVSIGDGRWSFTPQLGLIQGIGNGFFFDGIFDATFAEDTSHAGIEESVDPSFQAQTYLRYKVSPTTSFSIGYSGQFGGKRYQNESYTLTKTRNDQVRVFADTFLTSTLQVQGMLARDLSADGGFRNDLVAQIRFAKLF